MTATDTPMVRYTRTIFPSYAGQKKKYNPNGYSPLNNKNPRLASSLRPDTILKRNGATYILDAKMYQYGVTHNVE